MSTVPTRVSFSRRSLKTVRDKTNGSGTDASGVLSLRAASSTRRLYSFSESVTEPGPPAAGNGADELVLRACPAATTAVNKIRISAFISRLSFCHVENQTQSLGFGS